MQSPLTRVPDISRPDAIEARNFNLLVDAYLKGKNPNLKNDIKEQLLKWIDNNKRMQILADERPEVREVLPLSDQLSKISILGMQALSPNKFHDDGWYKSATSMLDEAAKPKAECEIKVIEGIKKLVSATK